MYQHSNKNLLEFNLIPLTIPFNIDFHCAMQSPRGGDLLANKTNNETPH